MAFVTRSNNQLMLNGSAWRFSAANFYEAIITDNPTIEYMTNHQQSDGLATIKEMGCTGCRCHTAGISVGTTNGNTLTLFPTLASLTNNTPNASTFERIDNFIYQAGLLGLRLIIPLTDDHQYYHGGLGTFCDWRGVSDYTQFYTNATIISDFKKYIGYLLNHVNQYNSIAYKNDPTILCWETGNELFITETPPTTWTTTIATYIKSSTGGGLGAQQLVMDGTTSGGQSINTPALSISNVDIYTDHYYPPNVANAQAEALACSNANKVFVIGEYDWTNNVGGTATMTLDTSTVPTGGGTQSLAVVVSQAASQDYFDQLQQASFALTSGHTYTMSFYAKSTGATYTTQNPLNVGLQQNYGAYNIYQSGAFATTNAWAKYSFTYTATQSDSNVLLYFNFGLVATQTNIDLVSLTDNAVPGTNLISNPSFESSTSAITPWLNNNTSIDTLSAFVAAIEGATSSSSGIISGDAFWDIYPHDDTFGYVLDTEVYTLYYPSASINPSVTQSDMLSRTAILRNHAYAMTGVVPPASTTPLAPTITSANIASNVGTVAWQGVVGGATYQLERSTGGAYTVLSSTLTDSVAPYQDIAAPYGSIYRIKALNRDSTVGPYSATYTATSTNPGVLSVSPSSFNDNKFTESLTLTNVGGKTLTWYASCSNVTFTPTTGTLASGASQSISAVVASGVGVSENFKFQWVSQ